MTTTFEEVKKALEKEYPQEKSVEVRNVTDVKMQTNGKFLTQFVVGVTKGEPVANSISYYERNLKTKLNPIPPGYIHCLPWPFDGYEKEEMKNVLIKLGQYLNIELDAEKMIGQLSTDQSGMYYIVTTIIQYPVVYVG